MAESEERSDIKNLHLWFNYIRKGGWAGIGVGVASLGLGIWNSSTEMISPLFNVLAVVVSVFTLSATLIYGFWESYVIPTLNEPREYFEKALGEIIGQKVLYTVFKQLVSTQLASAKRTEEVLEGLGVPVLARTLKLQGKHPLVTWLNMEFNGDREEDEQFGETLVVRRTIRWKASLLEKDTSLRHLIKPIFVCTSYVHQIPFMRELVGRGYIDLLWPIPWAWAERLEPNGYEQLKKFEWLEYTRLDISPYSGKAKDKLIHLHPEKFDCIWKVLEKCVPSNELPVRSSIGADTEKALAKHCMSVLYIDENEIFDVPPTKEGFTVSIDQESTYKVWVKGKESGDVLYRYDVPFLQPALVQGITFGLGGQTCDKHWILDPASVNCAFLLANEEARTNPQRQSLSWDEAPAEGTPFLPGHGVSFLWRKKPEEGRRET